MNDNEIKSIEWHRDQLAKLLADDDNFQKVESEIDFILEKAKTKKKVIVRRAGKTFYREQEVGRADVDKKVAPSKKDSGKSADTWMQRSGWSQGKEDSFFEGLSREAHGKLISDTLKESAAGHSDMTAQYEHDADYAKKLYNKKYGTDWDKETVGEAPAKAVTVDSIKSTMSGAGLGNSAGSGDRGVHVHHDVLKKAVIVKMNYGSRDKQDMGIRTEDSNKIKTALDKAGIKYDAKTDPMLAGQVKFMVDMK